MVPKVHATAPNHEVLRRKSATESTTTKSLKPSFELRIIDNTDITPLQRKVSTINNNTLVGLLTN